nr:TetR family transcriptional regulator [Glycomyces amatae]
MEVFNREGFDRSTVNDVAAAAGVSRSTFLRYFKTKEDAVLGALEAKGFELADALRSRPAGEDEWVSLRQSVDGFVEEFRQDADRALALARMVRESPSLAACRMEHQHSWQRLVAAVLAERAGRGEASLRDGVLAAAAIACVELAADRWTAGGGREDLPALVDEAFAALRPN